MHALGTLAAAEDGDLHGVPKWIPGLVTSPCSPRQPQQLVSLPGSDAMEAPAVGIAGLLRSGMSEPATSMLA